jgi:hypothetical protein
MQPSSLVTLKPHDCMIPNAPLTVPHLRGRLPGSSCCPQTPNKNVPVAAGEGGAAPDNAVLQPVHTVIKLTRDSNNTRCGQRRLFRPISTCGSQAFGVVLKFYVVGQHGGNLACGGVNSSATPRQRTSSSKVYNVPDVVRSHLAAALPRRWILS